jgi:hypothetical protein
MTKTHIKILPKRVKEANPTRKGRARRAEREMKERVIPRAKERKARVATKGKAKRWRNQKTLQH